MIKQLTATILLYFTLCIFFTSFVNSQSAIKLSEFKEPSGKLLYLRVNPDAAVGDSRRINLGSALNSRILKEHSIFNTFLGLSYQNLKSSEYIVSNIGLVNLNLDYTKYFTKRRGFFVETLNDSALAYNINNEKKYNINSINSIGIGIGRIEEVSTVNQAYRILNNTSELSDHFDTQEQEEIFRLATLLRELDYYFVRDARIRNLKRTEMFLDYFKENSIDLNDSYRTAQLLDGYLNSRYRPTGNLGLFRGLIFINQDLERFILNLPNDPIGEHGFGQKASLAIEHWSEDNSFIENFNATSLKIDLMKSFQISNFIRYNVYGLANYFIESPIISYAYRAGISGYYTPNARTNLGLSLQYKEVANSETSLGYFHILINSTYYISYNSVVTAQLSLDTSDSQISPNNNFSVQLNHYFY